MGQDSKIRESSYSRITTSLSEKEKQSLRYEEISGNEIEANKKHERNIFLYQVMFVIAIISLAFVKEIYFPSNIAWVEWIMQKISVR